MRFSTSYYSYFLGFSISAVIVSAAASSTSGTFMLWAEPARPLATLRNQVSFANGTAYIGDVIYQVYSEPLIMTYPSTASGSPLGQLLFNSYHSQRYLNFFIHNDASKPVGLTPFTSVPAGATIADFTVGGDGLLRWKNTNHWHACPTAASFPLNTYDIVYVGGNNKPPPACIAVALRVRGFGACV